MPKLKFTDEHLKDSFNVEFPNRDDLNIKNENDIERYHRSNDQMEEMEKAFEQMTKMVNSMSRNNLLAIAICRQMARTHRTLQQATIQQVLMGISAYLKWAQENGRFDGRNEAMVRMADDLEKLLEDHPLPFI